MIGKRMTGIIVIVIASLLMGGCGIVSGAKDRFSSQQEAQDIILQELREKYNMEFVLVGNEKYHDFGQIYGYTYSCEAAPTEQPEKVTYAVVTQRFNTQMRDDFALYYFKEEVEEGVKEMLDEKDYIVSYTLKLVADPTSEIWTAADDLDKYMKKNSGFVNTIIYLEEGKSDEEYVDMVADLLESAGQLDVSTTLGIKTGDDYIFFKEINIFAENPVGNIDKEQILYKISVTR